MPFSLRNLENLSDGKELTSVCNFASIAYRDLYFKQSLQVFGAFTDTSCV